MKKLAYALILFTSIMNTALACTLWGTVKPNEILIAKTRDFYPGMQEFKVINQNDIVLTELLP